MSRFIVECKHKISASLLIIESNRRNTVFKQMLRLWGIREGSVIVNCDPKFAYTGRSNIALVGWLRLVYSSYPPHRTHTRQTTVEERSDSSASAGDAACAIRRQATPTSACWSRGNCAVAECRGVASSPRRPRRAAPLGVSVSALPSAHGAPCRDIFTERVRNNVREDLPAWEPAAAALGSTAREPRRIERALPRRPPPPDQEARRPPRVAAW
jgi:hypothetical protein